MTHVCFGHGSGALSKVCQDVDIGDVLPFFHIRLENGAHERDLFRLPAELVRLLAEAMGTGGLAHDAAERSAAHNERRGKERRAESCAHRDTLLFRPFRHGIRHLGEFFLSDMGHQEIGLVDFGAVIWEDAGVYETEGEVLDLELQGKLEGVLAVGDSI